MQEIFNYFLNHKSALNKKHVPRSVIGKIKKLDRNKREHLKALIIEKAKGLDELGQSKATAIRTIITHTGQRHPMEICKDIQPPSATIQLTTKVHKITTIKAATRNKFRSQPKHISSSNRQTVAHLKRPRCMSNLAQVPKLSKGQRTAK